MPIVQRPVEDRPPASPSELPPPTILAYRQVLGRSLEDLDELLDQHAANLLVASSSVWRDLPGSERERLRAAIDLTLDWQRAEAAKREAAALSYLRGEGMQVHELSETQRQTFGGALPGRATLLPAVADVELQTLLVQLAGGTAAASDPLPHAPPDSPDG